MFVKCVYSSNKNILEEVIIGRIILRELTCGQGNFHGLLPVPKYFELWQRDVGGDADGLVSLSPFVPDVRHSVANYIYITVYQKLSRFVLIFCFLFFFLCKKLFFCQRNNSLRSFANYY